MRSTELDDIFGDRALAGTRWSVELRRDGSSTPVYRRDAGALLGTASLAKVFLLVEVATRIAAGRTDPGAWLDRRAVESVGDSGLWQHLATDRLPVEDAARLVGALSDNLATNVLLDMVGLEAVQARAAQLAPAGSTLHDRVRDARTRDTAATLSTGCATDWASVFDGLHRGATQGDPASASVLDWLAAGTDLSMVAAAFELDPLSHGSGADHGVRLWNKTGTDAGVRAEAGIVESRGATWTYAVICNWDDRDAGLRSAVLSAMSAVGRSIRGS